MFFIIFFSVFQFNSSFILGTVCMKSLNVFTIEVDFMLAVKCLVKSVRNRPIEHGHEKNDFFFQPRVKFFWLFA